MNVRNHYFRNNRAAWLICAVFSLVIVFSNGLRGQDAAPKGGVNKPADLKISKLPPKEKRWALIVGVNNFGLQGAVNDAKALKNTLIQYAGFDKDNIIMLTTDAAKPIDVPTRNNILSALDLISEKVSADGLFLFAFSGHGKTIEKNAFIVPSDVSMTGSPRLMGEQSIDASRLKHAIAGMKMRQVLIMLDSCRDKIEVDSAKGNAAQALTPDFGRGFSFENANKDINAYVTIFGTKEGGFAYEYFDNETKQWRGFFSRSLEKGLSGEAANEKGEVTLGGLVSYLEKNVPLKSLELSQVKQTPWKIGDGYREAELVLAVVNGISNQKADPGIKTERKTILQNRISILSPREGEVVDIKTIVSGKTSYADRSHYITVTPVKTNETWIMKKLEPDEEGLWKGSADFGDSLNGGGEKFLVRVFATADAKIPEGKSAGLPRDAVFSETITVTRRK